MFGFEYMIPALAVDAVIAILILVVSYVFPCLVTRNIARKAGLQRDWMAYCPIASDLYKMDIVSMPRWRALFFGFTGTAFIVLIGFFIGLLAFETNTRALIVFGALLIGAWMVLACLTTYNYYRSLFKAFGYESNLALLMFFPILGAIALFILQTIIAFDKRIGFNADPVPERIENEIQEIRVKVNDMGKKPAEPTPALIKGKLTGICGKYAGARFEIKKGDTVVIGRDSKKCNLVYDDTTKGVSREHCIVTFDGTYYFVTDSSSYGTFLDNGQRLPAHQTQLLPRGTVICLGSKMEQFRLE